MLVRSLRFVLKTSKPGVLEKRFNSVRPNRGLLRSSEKQLRPLCFRKDYLTKFRMLAFDCESAAIATKRQW
jgi:hypothetical protein